MAGRLLRTSKTRGRKAHYHVVYIGPDGLGITSEDNEHVHPVQIVLEMQPMTDEQGNPVLNEVGEPVIQPVERILIGEAQGHTHEVAELLLERKEDGKEDEEEVRTRVLTLYKQRQTALEKMITEFKCAQNFYMSNSYTPSQKAALRAQKRASHEINEVKPKIDLITGYLTERQTERVYKPVTEDDAMISDLLIQVNKDIDHKSNYQIEEDLVVEDQVKKGMGVLSLRVDTENNLEGDIIEERFNPEDVLFGPHEKLDASDCEFAIKRKWISLKKAKDLYPKKAEEITTSVRAAEEGIYRRISDEDTHDNPASLTGELQEELYGSLSKNVRLLDLLELKYRRVPVLHNVVHNFYFNADFLTEEDFKKAKTIPLLTLTFRVFQEVWSYKMAGNVLVEQGKTIFTELPIRPVYCVKDGDFAAGLIYFVKDLQKSANHMRSLFSDIINKVANYGYLYEKGAFTEGQLTDFLEDVGKPGFNLEVHDLSKIQPLQGIKFPSEVLALDQIYSPRIAEHMGINSVLLGESTSADSALVFQEKRRQALFGLRYLRRNLNLTKKAMAKVRLEAIQKVYHPERVMRLTQEMYPAEEVMRLYSVDTSQFDIVVTEDPHTDTFRERQFVLWTEIFSKMGLGALVPPQILLDFLLDLADISELNKMKLRQGLQALSQAQEQEKATTAELQLEASQPDDIKRMKLGLPPQGLTNDQLGLEDPNT